MKPKINRNFGFLFGLVLLSALVISESKAQEKEEFPEGPAPKAVSRNFIAGEDPPGKKPAEVSKDVNPEEISTTKATEEISTTEATEESTTTEAPEEKDTTTEPEVIPKDKSQPKLQNPQPQPLNPDPSSILESSESPEDFVPGGPNLFTVTNTDVGFTWEKLPFREKYQWNIPQAPCRNFPLKVPDERAEKAILKLCIFRPYLEFVDDTELFIHYVGGSDTTQEHKELTVFGYVKGYNESLVVGSIIDRYFYGEVTIVDPQTKEVTVYVVERIKLLSKLMRHNEKILTNILYVMENGNTPKSKYNAVVTKGASLMSFMVAVNPTETTLGSFLVFSTSHNSYITAGEPQMDVDDYGKISFNAGGDKIIIDPAGTVNLITRTRKYIFRPHGKTVVREGTSVDTLQEHEGSVAVSAFTSTTAYGCILPTPALSHEKKGGYVCKVCLAVDRLFQKYFKAEGFQRGSPITLLGRIIHRVSWIFRSTDWDDDGNLDNVGLDYDPQITFWTYKGDDENTANETMDQLGLERMLADLSRYDFSDCCLGIAFTMKGFPGILHGISSRDNVTGNGGVCGAKEDGVHKNLLLISGNKKQGTFQPLSEDQLVFVAAQEIARVFGAEPDGTGLDECDQFQLNGTTNKNATNKGHYVMWPNMLRTPRPEEKAFSPCSKKSIMKSITTCKSACFDVDKHPFCGNGIVEDGEECDCGSEFQCSQQSCCFSRIGKYPCRKTGFQICKSIQASDSKNSTESSALMIHQVNHLLPYLTIAVSSIVLTLTN